MGQIFMPCNMVGIFMDISAALAERTEAASPHSWKLGREGRSVSPLQTPLPVGETAAPTGVVLAAMAGALEQREEDLMKQRF